MFRRLKFWAIAFGLIAISASPALAQVPASGDEAIPAVATSDDGKGVVRVIAAERFTLETSYPSDWSAERPEVSSGLIVVLEVKKELVRPRQTRQPVLFAGDRPIEVLNTGFLSGRVVGIIADRAGSSERVDLAQLELYFGTPMLAERVTDTRGKEERTAAQKQGITPLPIDRRGPESLNSVALSDHRSLLARACSMRW